MKRLPIVVGILVVISITVGIAMSHMVKSSNAISTLRLDECIGNKCIDKSVFSELPEYPSNMREVAVGVYYDIYSNTENFSSLHPDEYYWKQPEFYGDNDFINKGLQYYTSRPMVWSAGSGAYKSSWVVTNLTVGDIFPVVTYWHAGYAIPKYQIFKLIPTFPENATLRLGTYITVQNPDEASKCLDVKITPHDVILDPTYPKFYYGWTQKILAEITVKCSGKWAVEIVPDRPDDSILQEYIYKYGIYKVSQTIVGGTWQIFMEVK